MLLFAEFSAVVSAGPPHPSHNEGVRPLEWDAETGPQNAGG